MKSFVLITALSLCTLNAVAQTAPRPDDHFWRRRVVSRVDLREKVNAPLVYQEGASYVAADSRYEYTRGMVHALVQGWRDGKYAAYNPDSLHVKLTLEQFMSDLAKNNGGGATTAPTTPTTTETTDPGEEPIDEEDPFGGEGDPFGGEEDPFAGDATDATGGTGAGDVPPASANQLNIDNLQYVLEIIEDRIFDKGRSDMVYDIKYIRLVFVDPDGNIPDDNMVAFSYREVADVLDATQWKNRFNDSENRSVREIMDLRLFNSFITDLSGTLSNSLQEAEQRKQQILEFEHHLWSY